MSFFAVLKRRSDGIESIETFLSIPLENIEFYKVFGIHNRVFAARKFYAHKGTVVFDSPVKQDRRERDKSDGIWNRDVEGNFDHKKFETATKALRH